jgi:hypothetical protein
LFGASPIALDETQSVRKIEKVVTPQARDDQHVSLYEAFREVVTSAHFEAVNSPLPDLKLALKVVSRMGKTDSQIFLRRQHRVSPKSATSQCYEKRRAE